MTPHDLIKEVENAKAIALYTILAMYADWRTKDAHPSRKTLAKRMGYSTCKAVDEALDVLVETGWVETFPRWLVEEEKETRVVYEQPDGKGWRQTSNGYIVHQSPIDVTPYPYRDRPPAPIGDNPLPLEGTTPYPYRGHEQEPIEQEPKKREPIEQSPPVVPPRGDAPAPAKTEPATPSKEIEPAKRAVVAAPRVDDEFVEWYAAYPRKTARKAAERAYKAARRSGATQDELLAGLERSKRSWAVEGRSKDKLPYPATWLNQGRWEDEETTRADVVERPVNRQETFMDVADRMIARMEMGTATNGWGELE